jgi:hypothetical protein
MHSITFSNAASFLTLLAVFKICFYSLHKISFTVLPVGAGIAVGIATGYGLENQEVSSESQ